MDMRDPQRGPQDANEGCKAMNKQTLTTVIVAAGLGLALVVASGAASWSRMPGKGQIVEEASHVTTDAAMSDGGAFSICLGCK